MKFLKLKNLTINSKYISYIKHNNEYNYYTITMSHKERSEYVYTDDDLKIREISHHHNILEVFKKDSSDDYEAISKWLETLN